MKNLRVIFCGMILMALASSCAKNYTCPTYVKAPAPSVEKAAAKG